VANGGPAPVRDRYFDLLRAIAIVRVVAYHTFPLAVLELAFPSMGVMFALGGSLTARSVDRSARRAVTSRLRRLLPPLWLMGAVVVPVLLWHGWPDHPSWSELALWVLPVADPPASDWGEPAAGVLWYLVTYLWLVLLSPLALKVFRRFPLPTIVLPLFALLLDDQYTALLGDAGGSVLTDVLTFWACWMLGFAHRDGMLQRVKVAVLVPLAVACVAGGLAWAYLGRSDEGFELANVPAGYGLYSLGFVLVLLRISPPMGWLARRPRLNGFVTFVNARAVTIYLWHNVAITFALVVADRFEAWKLGPGEYLADAVLAVALLAVVVAAIGWVEDLAARRRPQLFPWPATARPEDVPVPVASGR
jgi:peptidoglycan/LPS O-acetylase OafA/YrhL